MKRTLPLACLAAAITIATAQSPVPPPGGTSDTKVTPGRAPATRPIWRANLPGGTYEIVVGAIISVRDRKSVV